MQISNYRNRFILLFILSVVSIFIYAYITFLNVRSTEVINKYIHENLTHLEKVEKVHDFIHSAKTLRFDFKNSNNPGSLKSYSNVIDSIDLYFSSYLDTYTFEEYFIPKPTLIEYNQQVKNKRDTLNLIYDQHGFDSSVLYLNSTRDRLLDFEYQLKLIENAIQQNVAEDGKLSSNFAKDASFEFVVLFGFFCLFLFILFGLMLREVKVNKRYVDQLKYNKSLLKSISQPIITLDNEYKITGWNKYAAELYGWEEKEIIGKNFNQLLKSEFIKTTFDEIAEVYLKEDRWEGEMIHSNRSMREVHVKATLSAIIDKYGTKRGTVAVISDISEIKEMARKLTVLTANLEREVNRKVMELNHFFERITDAFFAVDTEWNYTYVNQKAAELHNTSIDNLLGKNIWEIHPEQVGGDFYNAMMEASISMVPIKGDFYYPTYGIWFEDSIFPSADGVSVYYHEITDKKNAEIKLEEAEMLFRNLVEASMVGVYILQKGVLSYINPRGAEILGYESDEIAGKLSILDLIAPEHRDNVRDNIRKRESGEVKSIHYELQGIHKDGHYVDLEAFGSFSIYKAENAIIGTLIDISQRKINEQERRVLQERLELVVKATNDAIWDWDIEKDLIIGNETFYQFIGIDKDVPISFDDFIQRLYKDDAQTVKDHLIQSFENREHSIVEVYKFIMPDGTYRFINDRSHILYNSAGKPYRMLGAMQDITKEKEAADNILAQKKLSDNIINTLPGVFYIFNLKGKFLLWNINLEKFTGYTKEDINRMEVQDFIAPNHINNVMKAIQNVVEYGEDVIEADLKFKDGTIKPFYFTGRSIEYEGEPCVLGVGLDISDKHEAQQKLQRSEDSFRTLIEQASDSIMITNMEGELIMVNSSASLLTGWDSEELKSKKIQDLITHENSKAIELDENDAGGNVLICEGLLEAQDGNKINIEWSSKKLNDNRYQYIIRDISRRKINEQFIRQSEHKYRLLFEENPMPMWMLSLPDKNFLAVNEAAVNFYGYSKEEFLSLNIEDIRPTKSRNTSNFVSAFKSGIQNAEINEMVKKNGDKVRVQIIAHDIVYEGQIAELELANDMTEKIQAEEDLKKSHEELRMLASYLEKARESERTHIAREIHDELGQQITGLKMDVSWLHRRLENADPIVKNKLKEVMGLLDGTVKIVRNLATKLRPSLLDDLGLVAAMEWQSEEFQMRTGIKTDFSVSVTQTHFPQDVSTNFFRIYQESLTNILRHARADKITVTLNQNDGIIELTIRDNGVGFEQKGNFKKHTLGLLGMKERTLEMNGTFLMDSKINEGTTIYIAVPLNA